MQPPELVTELQRAMVGGDEHLFAQLPLMISEAIKDRVWERVQDRKGQPFTTFESFVEHPLWQGLESSVDDLLAFCRKSPDTQAMIREAVSGQPTHADAGAKGGRGNKASDNVTGFRGNRSTYTLRRLKRDAPELAERVVKGELSANAAAIEAGFRERQVQLAKDPQRAAQTIIAARGLGYAKDLAAAIIQWEAR